MSRFSSRRVGLGGANIFLSLRIMVECGMWFGFILLGICTLKILLLAGVATVPQLMEIWRGKSGSTEQSKPTNNEESI